jgi:argininosuccinate lyase
MVELYRGDAEKVFRRMRRAAMKLKLFSQSFYSPDPKKQEALERMRRAVDEIIECLEILSEEKRNG